MGPPPSQTRQSSVSSYEHNYDNIIASYWRQHRKPATYLDDHEQGYRLVPLQPTSSPPLPPLPSSGKRYGMRNQVFTEGDAGASSTSSVPLPSVAIAIARAQDETGVGDGFATEKPTTSLMSSTFAKLSNMQRKRTNSDKSLTAEKHQKGKQPAAQKDSLESSSNPSPPTSSGTDGIINPESMDSSTSSSRKHSDGKKDKTSTGYETGYYSLNTIQDSPGQTTSNRSISTNNSNDSSNSNNKGDGGSGIGKTLKRQRPILPRIIIPDGTSINLSTPPSTPRYNLGPPIRPSQMTPWPYNFLQIKERLRMQTGPPKVPPKANQSKERTEHGRRRSSSERVAPQQQQQAQRGGNNSMETISRSNTPIQEEPQSQQRHQQDSPRNQHERHAPEPGETTGTAGTEATYEERGYLPEFGIMGLPMVYRAASLSSSEKYHWWGYDEHEHGPGGVFSDAFWRRRFGTRAAVFNTLKHAATTLLGILIIIAIALTALGKIKNRDLVSDSIPHSLEGTIMEAQVVVINDLSSLQKLKVAAPGSGTVTPSQQDALDQLEAIKNVGSSRIPIWTNPIREECFQKKCDFNSFGKEFFAFMNPESFGIALPENWPSLCNSCIEITRNQFVYKTTVRILGDLQTCFSPNSEDDPNRPTTPPPSYPLPPPLPHPVPIPPSFSPSLITAPITTMTMTTTESMTRPTTLVSAASPTAIRKTLRNPKAPKNNVDLSKETSHRPKPHLQPGHPPTASISGPPIDPIREPRSKENDLQNVRLLQGGETATLERALAPLQRRQAGPSSPPSPSSPSSSPSSSRVGFILPPTALNSTNTPRLPYLIVDPMTFDNLTRFDSHMAIQNMDFLHVQFRFVVCDD